MKGQRRLFIDDSPGERRGVVLLDGRPERLLIERDGEPAAPGAGARGVGRIRRVDRPLGMAFVDFGEGEGVLPLASGVAEGATLQIEVVAPARSGKLPRLKALGPGDGRLGLATARAGLEQRLRDFAPEAAIERGEDAREAAELAETAALASVHPLGGGASLAIESTRGLTAVDIDLGGAGAGDARAAARRVNALAVAEAARLLRLKGLGGLVVFDLVGRGQDGESVVQAARAAFAPETPGAAFGPVSRLGVFHLTLPWTAAPVTEQLVEPSGLATPRAVAQRLARALEREARTAVRVVGTCAPEVALAMEVVKPALLARLGPRVDIRPDPAFARDQFETSAR